jgi:hypothetical protein
VAQPPPFRFFPFFPSFPTRHCLSDAAGIPFSREKGKKYKKKKQKLRFNNLVGNDGNNGKESEKRLNIKSL